MKHPGQTDVAGEERLTAGPSSSVDAGRRAADDLAGPFRPLVERVLVDHEPDLLETAFDLFLGPDQSRHVRIASSILG